jgi:type II secretory pathway component GspD/PulD (secretin)
VKLNLKPETEVWDLVAWISSITCEQFVVPGDIAAGKKVTIYSPELITTAEAYRLFLAALDSVGLTVYRTDKFLRIIETAKARTSAIPVFGFDEEPPAW